MKKYGFFFVLFLVVQICLTGAAEFDGLEQNNSGMNDSVAGEGSDFNAAVTGSQAENRLVGGQSDDGDSAQGGNSYQIWADSVRISQGFTAADFLQNGNVAEVRRLLAILSEFCPASDSENASTSFHEFSLNVSALKEKLAEGEKKLHQLSLSEFETLRKSSAAGQNEANDFSLVQAFLQKLYEGSPAVPDSNAIMLKRIMARINELVNKSLTLYDKQQLQSGSGSNRECAQLTPDFVNSSFIEPWLQLKEVENTGDLNSVFPWSEMSRSCLKSTFSPGAVFISYLCLLRPVLESVLAIMNFTDSDELQANLQKIKASGLGINHAFRSGGILIISVPEMLEIPADEFQLTVRTLLATRVNIAANSPVAIERAMNAISSRITQIADGERVQQAIVSRSQAENRQILENLSHNDSIVSMAALLNRVLRLNGRVPADLSSDFYQKTGFTPNELAATAGSSQAIKELIMKRHADNISQPGFMEEKARLILGAVRKLAEDERLKKVEEEAVQPFLQNLIRKQLTVVFGTAANNFEIRVEKSQTIDNSSWLTDLHIFANSILLSEKDGGMLSGVPLSFDLKFQNLLLISTGNDDKPLSFRQKQETALTGGFEIKATSFQKIASNLVKKKKDINEHILQLGNGQLYLMARGGNMFGSVKIELNIGIEMQNSAFDVKFLSKKVSSGGLGGGKAREIEQQINKIEQDMKAKMPFNTAGYGIVTDRFRLDPNGLRLSFHSNDNISNVSGHVAEHDFTKIWPVVSGFLFGAAN
jgi:hypothetical protein